MGKTKELEATFMDAHCTFTQLNQKKEKKKEKPRSKTLKKTSKHNHWHINKRRHFYHLTVIINTCMYFWLLLQEFD